MLGVQLLDEGAVVLGIGTAFAQDLQAALAAELGACGMIAGSGVGAQELAQCALFERVGVGIVEIDRAHGLLELAELAFDHPATGVEVRFRSELPNDLSDRLATLDPLAE